MEYSRKELIENTEGPRGIRTDGKLRPFESVRERWKLCSKEEAENRLGKSLMPPRMCALPISC